LVPVAKAHQFKQKLAQLPYEERVDVSRYHHETKGHVHHDETLATSSLHKVKAGENLVSIADRNNTTPQAIRKASNLTANSIKSGMVLKMPAAQKTAAPATTTPKLGSAQIYVVKNGDTLWNVAHKFSVSDKDILAWNKVNPKTGLVLGQKLTIKAAKPQVVASSSAIRSISYTVKQGDSLAQISRKFNVSVADLCKWNPPAVSNSLTPGKKLKVILNT
jgi:membrane-bound lytic murein transglycosylase D